MAKWIIINTSFSVEYLINLDNIDSINPTNHNGDAVLEWGNGNCQITSSSPTFQELKDELIKKHD